jgi:hypothetical protein
LSAKRLILLIFLFLAYPFWNLYIRAGIALDRILYPDYKASSPSDPVFIIGNYRSGSTFFHRLLLKDPQFTCMKAWEIYFAPALIHRKLIRTMLGISRRIGSPLQKAVRAFDRLMNNIYPMHKTGLLTYEQDSQLFYHTWSSFNLFAIFPFPELARKYIYYDQLVPEEERERHFGYYREIIKRHAFLHSGQRYLSKNPDFTPALKTLLEEFPNAKIINLIRSPEGMLPSSVNLWAGNWKGYGSPEEEYPLIEVIKEYARHWYEYPNNVLGELPKDRYSVVRFQDLVTNPKKEVSRIYQRFGLKVSEEFLEILEQETVKSRRYNGNNHYSLPDMGLSLDGIKEDFADVYAPYQPQQFEREPG